MLIIVLHILYFKSSNPNTIQSISYDFLLWSFFVFCFVFFYYYYFFVLFFVFCFFVFVFFKVLESGIVFHSVIIGVDMGASQSVATIRPLLVALSFHQFFEGVGLGGCIAQVWHKMVQSCIASYSCSFQLKKIGFWKWYLVYGSDFLLYFILNLV